MFLVIAMSTYEYRHSSEFEFEFLKLIKAWGTAGLVGLEKGIEATQRDGYVIEKISR